MRLSQNSTNIWTMLILLISRRSASSTAREPVLLRKGVHNYLKRQKHVESYRLGEFGEGDAGVTIVEFKK